MQAGHAPGVRFGIRSAPGYPVLQPRCDPPKACYISGAGTDLSVRPLSLDYEQDPDSYLPADPGLFHVQGDDKRKKSHTIVSSLKARPLKAETEGATVRVAYPP